MMEKLNYRAMCDIEAEEDRTQGRPEVIQDVFDGEIYNTLRRTPLDGAYHFFDNPEDLALGLSTDGFTLFKRRRRGLSTAWPIILINYNLHPRYRTRLENVICVGVIPGPTQCKDINSFLVPVIEELLLLERGVVSLKGSDAFARPVQFVLRAFLIMLFGDIPAVSKLLAIKGHNAIRPCRACYIHAVWCDHNSTYYVPLTPPGAEQGLPAQHLPMRHHALFLQHYEELEALLGQKGRYADLAKDLGINCRPMFAYLKSINLAACAPYDMMHLIFENLVPNMILHWTGEFKDVNQGTGAYRLAKEDWVEIGKLTAGAGKTIPSAFVGTLPDIAKDRKLYKAEAFSFWFLYLGPILLKDCLPRIYYEHYLLIREVVNRILQFDMRRDSLDELDRMIRQWVDEYERLYYQYQPERLPTCPLTIHALLHMVYYIRMTGPLWASWAYVMERICGYFLPAAKNRSQPYIHLDNHVARRAQMHIICHKYNMPVLARSTVKWRLDGRERLSSRETRYPDFPEVILGVPVNRCVQPDTQLWNQLTKYFGVVYKPDNGRGFSAAELRERIDQASIVRYGRLRLADDGDRIRTVGALRTDTDGRDNTYMRYELLPDRNARWRMREDRPYVQVNYGQLLDIYYLEFIEDLDENIRQPYLLARVRTCKTNGRDAALAENPSVTYTEITTPDIIHINTITHVVGRVQTDARTWAIIDRSWNGMRTQFVDGNGDVEHFD
ncbi:Transposase family tnp2 [Ceratobasidium sp. AG-Ba]|nr:Transposase family tnp2 [Ceratobasidium sp. AG-Ba]